MAEPTIDRDPVEFLAEEFMERLRQGEYPSVEEYAVAHPDRAAEIRDLFPTIAAMEKLKSEKESLSGGKASLGPTKLERLGDLRIIREIGRGGMGIVYEAEQESLGRRVAVKVLPKQSLLDDKHLRRFRREAKTAARLHHTNIVPVLGVGEQDGYHYYVMQIIRGVGLDEIIPQLSALANGSDGDSRQFVVADRQRAENVISVARAMIDGDLRRLAAAVGSSDLASSVSRVATPSTASPAAAITEVIDANGADVSATSFALASSIEATALAAGSGSSINQQNQLDASAYGSPEFAEPFTAGRFGTAYWQSVAAIGVQISNALQYAHRQGTLHRDIKPANLLIDDRGNVWVADFGLAKAVEQDEVSRSGDIVGTLRYMAPEQFHGEADDRSDIFSLGLTLYELLTLTPAYNEAERKRSFIHESGPPEPTRPRRVNPAVPRDLETIVLKAISTEANARYASAADLAEDLQRFIEDRPILARRASTAERLWRWARRNPAISSLSALAAALLLTVAIVSTAAYLRTEQALAVAEAERQAAQKTSRVALAALDKIFEHLAPHRYVSPEDFALTTGEDETIPVDTQPVLSEESAALLTEMMKSYDELAQISGQNAELLQSVALANRRLGDIRARLGQTEQALKGYEAAIAAYESLDDELLQEPKTIAAIASLHNEIGRLLRHTRNEDWFANQQKADSAHERARQLLQPIAASDSLPEVRYELARTYYLTAKRFGRRPGPGQFAGRKGGRSKSNGPSREPSFGERNRGGDRQRAKNLDRAIGLLEQLTSDHDVPDYKELLAMCYVDRHSRPGNSSGSEDQSPTKAITLMESLVEQYPQNPDYGFTLSRVYMMTSNVGEPEDRLRSIESALAILKRLHDEYPSVPEYLLTQTWVQREAARMKFRLGDYEGARVHVDESRAIGEKLESQSTAPPEATRGFRMFRDMAFGMGLGDALHKNNIPGQTVPRDLLIRARDELARAEPEIARAAESSPFVSGMLKRLYLGQTAVFHALGDDEAASNSQAKADQLPDMPEFPRREGSRGPPR